MSLHNLRPSKGSTKRPRRLARGIGSGLGKTAGRGMKGQKARRQVHPNFEGGQTPLQRRLPVKKGFRNVNHKEFAIVNLDDLERLFKAGDTVSPETLKATGIISGIKDGLKILAFGDLKKKLSVSAHKFSKAAQEAIEKAGGSVTVLESKAKSNPVKKDKKGEAAPKAEKAAKAEAKAPAKKAAATKTAPKTTKAKKSAE
ncbi:MAG: 50S ribosomal protein L15 [Chthonomonas sp.]|nr:50S ribosomal protein L15 [Chthonomonas sp.]